MDDDSEMSDAEDTAGTSGRLEEQSEQMTRESSPELARISALITRPPKQKSSNKRKLSQIGITSNGILIDSFLLLSSNLQNKPPTLVRQFRMNISMQRQPIELITIHQ